jgi:DNA polymerase
MGPADVLQAVAREVNNCTCCQLYHSRKHAVPGEGPANAEILLIGEGPGFHENEQGLPFVGAAGKLLDDLLKMAGLKRENVFITNVVKCRPPGNRDPLPDELAACSVYLERQIEAINPLVIVTLGRYSMARYIPDAKISVAHGKPRWVNGRLIVPMYHPAAALHQMSLMKDVEKDFSHLMEWVQQAKQAQAGKHPKPAAAAPEAEEAHGDEAATQLSLF